MGCPYRFLAAPWGWGTLLAALIFGLTHTSLLNPTLWGRGLRLPWGLWTAVGGLVFGFLRNRTGSAVPSAILHGLPQAIAASLMLLV